MRYRELHHKCLDNMGDTLGAEDYGYEVEQHEGRVAASGEARGLMRQQTGALAGAMGDEGDGGSVGGDGKRTIEETDDFTGMMMYVSDQSVGAPLSRQHFHSFSALISPSDAAPRGRGHAGQPEAHRGRPEPRD